MRYIFLCHVWNGKRFTQCYSTAFCHLNMTFNEQMLHVWTRKKADVRRQAVTAQVMWLACTPIIGASLAARTKTGYHQKVSSTPVCPPCLPHVDYVVQWCARFLWSMLCQLCECCHDWQVDRQVGFISFVMFCLGSWFCLLVCCVLCYNVW